MYDNRLILILAVNTLLLIIIPLSVLHWVIPDKMCTPIEGKLKKKKTFSGIQHLYLLLKSFKTWNFKQGWYRGEINKFEHLKKIKEFALFSALKNWNSWYRKTNLEFRSHLYKFMIRGVQSFFSGIAHWWLFNKSRLKFEAQAVQQPRPSGSQALFIFLKKLAW